MVHLPILRNGIAYESIDQVEIVHHATGAPVALVSQANSGMVARDISRMDDTVLESFSVRKLMDICKRAAELFMTASLPLGNESQSFDDYIEQLSATTGMPVGYCRGNASKIHSVMDGIEAVVMGLTRGFDLEILDRGYGPHGAGTLSYYRAGRLFGAVLPSNSPGVHSLWIPAFVLKAPIVLKPGREEPWTPYRVIEALCAAGAPRAAFGFYPTDHAGAGELLRSVDRSMLFGAEATTRPWKDDPGVEVHGPGYSKVLLGDDAAAQWEDHIDLMASSISANGGRSCINASAVWTPRNGRKIAEALAARFADVKPLPPSDPCATLAAFANPLFPEQISSLIDQCLATPGAVDLTADVRGSSRLVRDGRCSYLLPTVVWCDDAGHALAGKEFLFPYAAVVECPTNEMALRLGPTLVATVLTEDQPFRQSLMACSQVDRLNFGPVPTWRLSMDQPHEGNLFEHLYRQRAFQAEPVV